MRLRGLLANLALLAGSTVVCLLLAELGLRLAGAGRKAEPNLSDARVHDTLLGWRHKRPGVGRVVSDEYDVTERFNSRGIRGPEYAIAKPRGTVRVLLLGDSFVEGYSVPEESTASALLEPRLAAAWHRPVEVFNGGSAGFSTDQEFLNYVYNVRRYGFDVVVLFPYVNDIWFNNSNRYWRGYKPWFAVEEGRLVLHDVPVPPPDPESYAYRVEGGRGIVGFVRGLDAFFGRRSYLYAELREFLKTNPTMSNLLFRLGFGEVPGEFRAWRIDPDPPMETAWQVTDALIAALRDSVVHDGARFLLFHVPSRPAIYDDDWARTRRGFALAAAEWSPRQDTVRLRRICDRHHIECYFPEEAFRRAAAEHPERRLYFVHDEHWTSAGHALAAAELARILGPTPPR